MVNKQASLTPSMVINRATDLTSGTVTSVSVVSANGVSGSVATATTTPAITLTLGAITPTTTNGLTITPNGTNTLDIAAGKTVVISNGITFAGTDATVMTFPAATATIAGLATVQTFTNKRITPRVLSAADYTTDTGVALNIDNLDQFIVTAQAGDLLFNNPTGTPTDGQRLFIAVTGTASRALTRDTQFEASTVALPSTTSSTARLNMEFIWRADTSKWVCILAV